MKYVKKARIYISSFIFIALTLIKIAFPSVNSQLSYAIKTTLQAEKMQTEELIEAGEKVLYGKTFGTQHGIKTLAPEKRIARKFAENAKGRFCDLKAEYDKETELKNRVAAFAEEQASFTDSAIPQNVIMAIPELGFEYSSPVEGITSSGFGYRAHPILNDLKFHYGTDFAANTGTPVKAFADGNVIAAGLSDTYGKYIVIDHGNGYSTLYAHCSELLVGCGEVNRGDVIALVGETGLATGPHLHFEIRDDGSYLNPEFYL